MRVIGIDAGPLETMHGTACGHQHIDGGVIEVGRKAARGQKVSAARQALGIGGAVVIGKEEILQRLEEAVGVSGGFGGRILGAAFGQVQVGARHADGGQTVKGAHGIVAAVEKGRDGGGSAAVGHRVFLPWVLRATACRAKGSAGGGGGFS